MNEWREDARTDKGATVVRGRDMRMKRFAWQDEGWEGRKCVREWEQRALDDSCDDPGFALGRCSVDFFCLDGLCSALEDKYMDGGGPGGQTIRWAGVPGLISKKEN